MNQDKTLPPLPVSHFSLHGPTGSMVVFTDDHMHAYGERCVAAHLERTGQSVTNDASERKNNSTGAMAHAWFGTPGTAKAIDAVFSDAPPEAAQKYDDTLLPFLALMRAELHANSAKGDRPGWLRMDANTALLEIYWHAAKLSAAVKNNDGPKIVEHSADVANMAMMLLDVCGGLSPLVAALAAQPKG